MKRERETMRLFTDKKHKILAAVLIGIAVIGVIVIITIKACGLRIINKSIIVEAGEELDYGVEDLVKADAEVLSQISLDVSGVDTNKTGEYTAFT